MTILVLLNSELTAGKLKGFKFPAIFFVVSKNILNFATDSGSPQGVCGSKTSMEQRLRKPFVRSASKDVFRTLSSTVSTSQLETC